MSCLALDRRGGVGLVTSFHKRPNLIWPVSVWAWIGYGTLCHQMGRLLPTVYR
ncbi:MAG: hypothetical protein QOJ33_2183 [Chloroflexota bacterium]|nr:hypothetical protein [Chloroflexota bacterium]